ncbi:MAG: hypothetical protein DYG88_09230 [Chloroflexi bacterium CFX4]|nr:hypothetical protein [Chloroflexi bacterium CFX4]MDL1922203.1 hypothetical protein [Chloroflexi bacterium CFX3]
MQASAPIATQADDPCLTPNLAPTFLPRGSRSTPQPTRTPLPYDPCAPSQTPTRTMSPSPTALPSLPQTGQCYDFNYRAGQHGSYMDSIAYYDKRSYYVAGSGWHSSWMPSPPWGYVQAFRQPVPNAIYTFGKFFYTIVDVPQGYTGNTSISLMGNTNVSPSGVDERSLSINTNLDTRGIHISAQRLNIHRAIFCTGSARPAPLTGIVSIYRPSDQTFYLRYSQQNSTAERTIRLLYALPGDEPIVGDWDGDGYTNVGVYRPSTAQFLLTTSESSLVYCSDYSITHGNPNSQPIAGRWHAQAVADSAGVRSGITFFLRRSLEDDTTLTKDYGMETDTPLVGNWAGDWDRPSGGVAQRARHVLPR